MINTNYKDELGRELKVKFTLGGFDNDITICELYREIKVTLGIKWLGLKPKYIWKKVYFGVTADNLDVVSKYDESDYHKLALKTITEYNSKEVSREKIKQVTSKLNQI